MTTTICRMREGARATSHCAPRRSFLMAVPAVASVMCVSPWAGATALRGHERVGVILPASERFPGARHAWLEGFESELRRQGVAPTMAIEHASTPSQLRGAVNALLQQEVRLVAAWSDGNELLEHQHALADHGVRLVLSDFGAKALRKSAEAHVVRCGPELWRHAFAAGHDLARRGARSMLVVAGYYESGFDLVHATLRGFRAGGGQRHEIVVTGTPDLSAGDAGWLRANTTVQGAAPDVVMSLHSAHEIEGFHTFWVSRANRWKGRALAALVGDSDAPRLASSESSAVSLYQPRMIDVGTTRSTISTDSMAAQAGRSAAQVASGLPRPTWATLRRETPSFWAPLDGSGWHHPALSNGLHGPGAGAAGWLSPYGA